MSRTYQTDRIVVEHRATHMTAQELANLCHVNGNVIRKACQLGKVQAVRAGRLWLIPRLDGQLFAAAYLKENSGETWTPKVKPLPKRVWVTNPQAPQGIKVELSPAILGAIDTERMRRYNETGRRNSRTAIIVEALEAYLLWSDK